MSRSNPWSHKIDYDAAIAADEAEIAATSSEFAKVAASESARLSAAGKEPFEVSYWKQPWAVDVLEASAAARAASGLTNDEIRALLVRTYDGCGAGTRKFASAETEALGLGPIVDWRADWRLGDLVARKRSPLGEPWGGTICPTEEQRELRLKRAKSALARHKRNREKFGR